MEEWTEIGTDCVSSCVSNCVSNCVSINAVNSVSESISSLHHEYRTVIQRQDTIIQQQEVILHKLDSLMHKIESQSHDLDELKTYVKQQSIVSRMTLPFSRTNEPEFNRARFANLAIRQNLPFSLEKAKTS